MDWLGIQVLYQSILVRHRIQMINDVSARLRFGCYRWGIDPDTICYCGSFSKDYTKSKFRSNLHGRLHNYLQNHGSQESERKTTNLIVFDNVNVALQESAVQFQYLEFESLEIRNDVSTYQDYCQDPSLVKAVEQLLIALNRRIGQCEWNRG